jgi:hypothetical protein
VTFLFIILPISEAFFSDTLSLAGLQEHLIDIAVRDIAVSYIGPISLFQTGEAFHQLLAYKHLLCPETLEQHFRQRAGPLGLQQTHQEISQIW